ncbi:MAG: nickel pincer cofactor biosynthesis protein LarC [Bacteroidia bacterium]|nr:nickel pincer cofactor biosynthesis protein LarC [Bacteroidia bacterium]
MKIAYLDIISGISGDMTLGALVHAGASFDALRDELRKLPLEGYEMTLTRVHRSMIATIKIDVLLTEAGRTEELAVRESLTEAPHDHTDHAHTHTHTHSHASHVHTHGGQTDSGMVPVGDVPAMPHRHVTRAWSDIRALIEQSVLSARVKQRALDIFSALAQAEAQVHGCAVDDVHFHEVGAVDSIIDIVGTAICLELLGVERVYTSAVRTGSGGHIDTQHGVMPVPAPATLELLRGYPIELTDVPFELTTPTGAAIIAASSRGVMRASELLSIDAIGYGAGSKEYPGLPNVLRVLIGSIGEPFDNESGMDAGDTVTILECSIDDMNPEVYPWVMERVLEAGALDCWTQSVVMKKGRPGQVLTVLAPLEAADVLQDLLLRETSSLGVRRHEVRRRKLHREIETVDTRYGPIRVKRIGTGERMRRVPEFEECRRLAGELNLPLLDIYRSIEHDSNRD